MGLRAGTNAKRAPGKDEVDYHPRPTKFHALLGRLLPTALRLAAGAEPVARKLFGELVPQLVHWLTRSARTCAPCSLVLPFSRGPCQIHRWPLTYISCLA